jgi:DNA processing protein
MMDTLHAIRVARAGLAFLFDPHSAYLRSKPAVRSPPLRTSSSAAPSTPRCCDLNISTTALRDLRSDIVSALSAATRDGGRVVIPEDPDWPSRLADLAADPPEAVAAALCLFVRGNAPLAATLDRSVTITGARAATSYGGHLAADLAPAAPVPGGLRSPAAVSASTPPSLGEHSSKAVLPRCCPAGWTGSTRPATPICSPGSPRTGC